MEKEKTGKRKSIKKVEIMKWRMAPKKKKTKKKQKKE